MNPGTVILSVVNEFRLEGTTTLIICAEAEQVTTSPWKTSLQPAMAPCVMET